MMGSIIFFVLRTEAVLPYPFLVARQPTKLVRGMPLWPGRRFITKSFIYIMQTRKMMGFWGFGDLRLGIA
jgi:hypothetical protein